MTQPCPGPAPTLLALDRLRAAPLNREPFDFVLVDDFVQPEAVPMLLADFPRIRRHGSFPLSALDCGPAFRRLAEEMSGAGLRAAIEEKFGVDLAGRPTLVTVRGWSDGKDGRIHTDSLSKIITLLLYMNPAWETPAGRLRLLSGPQDIEDYVAEVMPLAGRMVAFRRSETSFHGHLAHVGERRVVQLNWVVDEAVVRRESGRHQWSARWKAWNPFA